MCLINREVSRYWSQDMNPGHPILAVVTSVLATAPPAEKYIGRSWGYFIRFNEQFSLQLINTFPATQNTLTIQLKVN